MRSLLLLALCSLALGAADRKSVWDGAYTAAQAARGETVYFQQCSRCHREDLSAYGGVLIGGRFMSDWKEDTADSFFTVLKQTMPRNAPASLPDAAYLDVVAYVFRENSFPPGDKELTLDNLRTIRIEGKEGPGPVPDFALVEVAGCLTQGTDGKWLVKNATEPVRTRNPKESNPEDLKAWESKPLGNHDFGLLDDVSLRLEPMKNHKVDAKGLLIRKPGNDRLNPTSIQPLPGDCPK